MKNILNIIKHDTKKLTSSVVAIITIMGLCIVPCLYAWFNIFSNWAPYESEATGRIKVAVANDDKGADMLGLNINVGDVVIEGLQSNNDIGWVFLDSGEEAVEGVYSGEYYAALVVPEEFSMEVMSFASGELKNPTLKYYENEKKNAIAPKITDKAKTAVMDEVNATFVETLAKYVSDAATVIEANGYDPQMVFSDIGDKMEILAERLDDCETMLTSANALAKSADNLLTASDQLLGSTANSLDNTSDIIGNVANNLPDDTSKAKSSVSDTVAKEKTSINKSLETLYSDLQAASKGLDSYNAFVDERLDKHIEKTENMRLAAERTATLLNNLGFSLLARQFEGLEERLSKQEERLGSLDHANERSWAEAQKRAREILEDIDGTLKVVNSIDDKTIDDIDVKINDAINKARKAAKNAKKSLSAMEGDLGSLSNALESYSNALSKLQGSLDSTEMSLDSMEEGLYALAEIFNRAADDPTLRGINSLLSSGEESIAEYLASPVKMRTEVIYPTEPYGSAMAAFYTVLAQYVGSLLTCVMIKTRLKKRNDLQDVNLVEHFFGRYGLFMFVGLAQALIVSLGDLLYVRIQCLHPVLFVLQACMNGIAFMMINYALVFSLDAAGLALCVIILVLQVAGSGGTYPVEVLPQIFRTLYPAMPFKYSMTAMRECISGMYANTYAHCMGVLALYIVVAIPFGLLMYKPAQILIRLIDKSKERSGIML